MITTICVCGAGTMGSGIAQVAAQAGFRAIQYDVDAIMLDKSKASIIRNLEAQVEKGRFNNSVKNIILQKITFTDNIADCVAGVIIEAIVEVAEAKIDLFNSLSLVNNRETIFATNTSSLPIKALAQKITAPERVIGMHFFNPAYAMKLVEVVKSEQTSAAVVNTIIELAKQMGKTPVVCKDAPGFIVNRVARPYYLEAMRLLESGHATAETIDRIMEASGFKMGPFKLMDLIGLDINYNVSSIVYEALDKPERLKPSILQKQKVENRELGRKSGKGFYNY